MVKKTVVDILLSKGVINSLQRDECLKVAKETGQSVEECLLSKKYITPVDIARVYGSYASLPVIEEMSDKMANVDLLAKVPLQFLRVNAVMPVIKDGQLYILTANPTHFQPLDELKSLLGNEAEYAVAPKNLIIDSINKYYPLEGTKEMIEELEGEEEIPLAFEEIEEKDILTQAGEAPIIKLVNHILYQAVKEGASDIHIEPFEKELRVRYRVDGVMHDAMTPPKRMQPAIVSRIKIMAHLNIAEKRIPQDGRIPIKVGEKAYDIRVSVLPTTFGERIVMRLLDKSRSFVKLDQYDFSKRDHEVVERTLHRPNGIIYVTGPTGSGKTTTLYSMLSELNDASVNIITVEDPVEYQMHGVNQVQVRDKVGLTFAAALRSILRQDPDIVMIGETRDAETAQIAIQAALTGHLVLSTLHTNDAPSSITRLIDMGVEPFLIASSINMVIAQRLVRRLCDKCKRPYKPAPEVLKDLGISPERAAKITFYEAVGCDACLGTGYKGRLAIFEVMEMTEPIAQLTMERADTTRLKKQAVKDGMSLLVQDGVRKIEQGLTTISEVLSVATMDTVVFE